MEAILNFSKRLRVSEVHRQILKKDTLNYQYQLRKKLYKTFLGSPKILVLAIADYNEHQANLNISVHQFDEKWNIVYDSLMHFENGIGIVSFSFAVTCYQHS